MTDRAAFRRELRNNSPIWFATIYDAISAKIAQSVGYQLVFSSGYDVTAARLAQPDLELLTLTENVAIARAIANACSIPYIADADTGYGGVLNVMRTVAEFERAGVHGITIEDQVSPKSCPNLAKVRVTDIDVAAAKIRAAAAARSDVDFIVVARTDTYGCDDACRRAEQFARAGADLVWPTPQCFGDLEDLRRIREASGLPLKVIVYGLLEQVPPDELEDVAKLMGYSHVAMFSAAQAMAQNMRALLETRGVKELPLPMMDRAQFERDLIDHAELAALEKKLSAQ